MGSARMTRAELAIDVPILANGITPSREQGYMQNECARGVENGKGNNQPCRARVHQLHYAHEIERDPRNVEEVGRELVRDAVVELAWWIMDVFLPESVLPCVDADEDKARDPGEDYEAVGDIAGLWLGFGFSPAKPESKDDGY
ncbi:hypothetical protein O1611_g8836 [Lasiodiplodia mahajangana]|uniref:Uncharacterized protein n=1 Tax=Lasiodiplodia mahajangana TaxID=1108764 RepID=A0ACC2JBD0_9PEZI|nr:hypothetical protein O1611_g8836 [Lasiodiplodia mahajangana]